MSTHNNGSSFGTGDELLDNNNNNINTDNVPDVNGDCPPEYTRSPVTGDCVKIDIPDPVTDPGEPPEDDTGDDTQTPRQGPGIIGCMDETALNYNPSATFPCGTFEYLRDDSGELISGGFNDQGEEIYELEFKPGGSANVCCVYPGFEGEPGPDSSDAAGTEDVQIDYEDAKPSNCQDVVSELPEQVEFIKTCINNSEAYIPNWLAMDNGQVFLNQRTCEYSVVIFAEPPDCSQDYLDSFIPEAVETLLRFYNKQDITEFNGDIQLSSKEALIVGGVSREGKSFTGSAQVKTFYISPRPLEKTRVLLTVDAEEFNRIPEREETYSQVAEVGFGIEPSYVVFYTKEILDIFNVVSRTLRSYENPYADWCISTGKVIKGLNLTSDANRIESFYKDLSLFIRESGMSFLRLENIEIGFDSEYQIEYIKVKKKYRAPVLLEKGFEKFSNSIRNKNKTTMAYISRLPDIREELVARSQVSWYNILTKYRFPKVEEVYVNDLTSPIVEGNTGIKALVESGCSPIGLKQPGKSAGDWTLTQVNSIKDALFEQLRAEPCLAVDGKILEHRNRENLATQLIDMTLKEYLVSDRIFSDLPELIANGRWDSIEQLYTGLLDNLGYCGIIDLIKSAIDCLLNALGYDDSIKIIIGAAIRGMDSENFSKFINALPDPVQRIIISAVNERYPQLLPFLQSLVSIRMVDDDGIEIQSVVGETLAYSYTSAGKWTRLDSSSRSTSSRTFYNRIADPQYPPATSEDYSTLAETVVDLIVNDLLEIDDILQVLESLPGASIAISTIQKLDKFCAAPPRIYPPLTSLFQIPGINIDICQLQEGITLPVVPKLQMPKLTIAGITDVVIENALVALKEILRRILVLVLRKIIEIIFEELCKQRVNSGSVNLKSLMQAGCSSGLDETIIDRALADIADNLGVLPDSNALGRFVDNISSVLTECELLDLINGTASDTIYELVHQIILVDPLTEPLSQTLHDKESISDFFKSLGLFIDPSTLCALAPIDLPFSQQVCDDLGLLNLFRDTRAQALRDKGVDGECIEQQLCLLRDKTSEDLKELMDMLHSGIFDNILPDFVQDPRTPENPALLPSVSPDLSLSLETAFDSMYETLTVSYTTDLLGTRGFLNMCLADSRGRGFAQHKTIERSILGPSLFNVYGSRGTRTYPAWNEWGAGANRPRPYNSWVDGGIEYSENSLFVNLPFLFNPLIAVTDDPTAPDAFSTEEYEAEEEDRPDPFGRPPAVGGLPHKVAGYLQDQLFQFEPGFDKDSAFTSILRWEDYDEDDSRFSITFFYNFHLDNFSYKQDAYSFRVDIEIGPQGLIKQRDSSILIEAEDPIPDDILNFIEFTTQERTNIEDQSDVWAAFVENVVTNASLDPDLVPETLFETFNKISFERVNKEIFKMLAQDMSKTDIFDYGFDFQSVPEIIYFHLDQNGEYEGDLAGAIQRYGGSEANPPFYIKQPEEFGFLKIANQIAPEVSNCLEDDEQSTRFPNFFELKDTASSLIGKFRDDERLSYCEGNILNVIEAPFDRALPAASVALNESLIYATIRIYISELMLKALPAFAFLESKYPKNYTNIFTKYVAQIMVEGLKQTGRGSLYKRDFMDYYYTFMEQVVQTYASKLDYDLVTDPTEQEIQALTNIRDFVESNWEGFVFYKNDPLRTTIVKRQRWRAIFESDLIINNCLTILERYIGEELTRMTSLISRILPKNQIYPIETIDDILINSPNRIPEQPIAGVPVWNDVPYIAGAVNELSDRGPVDVPTLEYYTLYTSGAQNRLPHPMENLVPIIELRNLPFVLERYATYTGSNPHPYGKIINIFDCENVQSDNITDLKFGLRLSYVPNSNEKSSMDVDSLVDNIDDSIAYAEKAFTEEYKNIIPLVSVELDLREEYAAENYGLYLKDLICLLIATEEYRTLFRYIFPVPKYMSMLAIYSANTFVPSIGQLKDGWAATVSKNKGGGQWIGFGKFGGMRTWRGNEGTRNSFKQSKRVARQLLEASCNTNYNYRDRDLLTPTEAYVDLQKPKDDKGFGIKWWQWSSLRPPPCKKDE